MLRYNLSPNTQIRSTKTGRYSTSSSTYSSTTYYSRIYNRHTTTWYNGSLEGVPPRGELRRWSTSKNVTEHYQEDQKWSGKSSRMNIGVVTPSAVSNFSFGFAGILAGVISVLVCNDLNLSEPMLSKHQQDDEEDEDDYDEDDDMYDMSTEKRPIPERTPVWDNLYWWLFDTKQYFLRIHEKAMANFYAWWGKVDEHLGSQPRLGPFLLPEREEPPWGELDYTLVCELKVFLKQRNTSVVQHNFGLVKRPATEYFIEYLGNFMEFIIYTDEPFKFAFRAVESLDPERDIIRYNLFREQCRRAHGRWIKVLTPYQVTNNENYTSENWDIQENVLVMKEWDGNRTDTTLLDLVPFFQDIAMQGIDDVRPIIQRVNEDPSILEEYKFQRMEEQKTNLEKFDLPLDVHQALQRAYTDPEDPDVFDEDDALFKIIDPEDLDS